MTEETKMSPLPKLKTNVIENTMGFADMIKPLLAGRKIHKLEWKDKEFYGVLDGVILKLHRPDGNLYSWELSEGDLLGEDWIII